MSTDLLAEKYPNKTPYHYCSQNPVNRIDPTGMEDHVDDHGNVIARFENDDKSIFMHVKGTTQQQIEEQRKDNIFNGSIGNKIGEIGGNVDVTEIMKNMLPANGEEASQISGAVDMLKYKELVQQDAKWDLKNNTKTIFGIGWDPNNEYGTTFSFGEDYTGMSSADIGNYHAGYVGRYANIHRYLLWKGAGFAETIKDFGNGKILDGLGRSFFLLNPFSKQSGDGERDYRWNTQGMNDGDRDRTMDALLKR